VFVFAGKFSKENLSRRLLRTLQSAIGRLAVRGDVRFPDQAAASTAGVQMPFRLLLTRETNHQGNDDRRAAPSLLMPKLREFTRGSFRSLAARGQHGLTTRPGVVRLRKIQNDSTQLGAAECT
jgi:hypothetical protein